VTSELVTTPEQERGQALVAALKAARVKNPSREVLDTLQQALAALPGFWAQLQDLTKRIEDLLISTVSKDPIIDTALRQANVELRQALGYAGAPALEQLLIDQVIVTRLRLQHAELLAGQVIKERGAGEAQQLVDQALNGAQARHLRAIESLARVRKLGITLQVNIATNGGQQVVSNSERTLSAGE
jgi:hypothetical protein